jgi:hypothetical protein
LNSLRRSSAAEEHKRIVGESACTNLPQFEYEKLHVKAFLQMSIVSEDHS